MPQRIVTRWGKHVKNEQKTLFEYRIHTALKRANVSADEFKKCWAFVAPRLSEGEIFNLLNRGGFGQPTNTRFFCQSNHVVISMCEMFRVEHDIGSCTYGS